MTFKFIDPDWALSETELGFLKSYRGKHKLQCALFLKFFQKHASFPSCSDDFLFHAIRSITEQLNNDHSVHDIDFDDRTARRQKQNIREFMELRLPVREDYEVLQNFLATEIVEEPDQIRGMHEGVTLWCLENKIEKPANQRLERIIKAALAQYEEAISGHVLSTLLPESCDAIDGLFSESGDQTVLFSLLKNDPGKASVSSVMKELLKLGAVNRADIPADLFAGITDKTIAKYRMRAATETIWHMRRHPDGIRYTLASAFLLQRRREIIDGLVELLIQTIHHSQN